jgi:hypothetical protein
VLSDWTFLQFGTVLLQPIVMFLLAVLVFPGAVTSSRNFREYFFEQRQWYFGLLATLIVVSALKDVARGTFPVGVNLAFHLLFGAGALAGFTWKNERLHHGLAYGTLILFAAYIAVLFAKLQTGQG